jgi:hypothetical protein
VTSRDAKKFWTSGQWMTERKGGSDVADGTETIAVPQADGTFKLWGYKWFTSASDSDMTITLARFVLCVCVALSTYYPHFLALIGYWLLYDAWKLGTIAFKHRMAV